MGTITGTIQRLSYIPANPNFVIKDISVKQVSVSKSLGVKIDQNLNWEDHIHMISKKISSGISAIKRIRYFVPREAHLTV